MAKRYFINKELQVLQTFTAVFAALPLCMLVYLFATPEIDNRAEMLKVFSAISAGVFLLSAFVWKKLAALPAYYLFVAGGNVSFPMAAFFHWNGDHAEVKLNDIRNVVHEPNASGSRSNLVISLPSDIDIPPGNRVLGQIRFEQENNELSVVICGLKKKRAEQWKTILSP